MKKSFFIFLTILILVIFIAGCKGECKTNSDCNDNNDCTKDSCVKKKCVNKPIKDCTCGNKVCEADKGETKCTCAVDCGKCTGNAGKYLSYQCVEDDCVTDVAGEVRQKSVTEVVDITERRVSMMKLLTTYTYDDPFNLKGSLFNVNIKFDTKLDKVTNPKVTGIQILKHEGTKDRRGRWTSPNVEILAEKKDMDRNLWDVYTEVSEDLRIQFKSPINNSNEETVTVKLIVVYDSVDARGNDVSMTYEFEKDFKLTFVNPSKAAQCPENCDDANPCTIDNCIDDTGYCSHIMKSTPCLGNFKCDKGENRCTAPVDCGTCQGDAGEYTQYACKNEKCVAELIDSSTVELKRTNEERPLPSKSRVDIKFMVTKSFKEPFDINKDYFSANFEVLTMSDKVSGFKFTKAILLEGTNELASLGLNNKFTKVGSVQEIIISPGFQMLDVEKTKTLKLKVYYSYDGFDSRGDPISYTNQVFDENLGEDKFVKLG